MFPPFLHTKVVFVILVEGLPVVGYPYYDIPVVGYSYYDIPVVG